MVSEKSLNNLSKSSTPAKSRRWMKPCLCLGAVLVIALLPLIIKSPYYLHILILTFIYMVAAASLRTITISGQWPLAHGAFFGIGAYAAGMASKWIGWSPCFTIPFGGLVAMGIGILTGYPFARLRALYYAMGSLFFGIGVIQIIQAMGDFTGGYSGLAGIHPIFLSGSKVLYYYFFLGFAFISFMALYRFEFSRIGVNLKAIAQSHLVASSIGINEAGYRIMVVGVGCFFAGLIGAAYAHYKMVISPDSFNFMATLWLVMYILIGGIGSFAGPIVGVAIGVIIPELFRGLKTYSPFIFAVILLIVVYLLPKGLASIPHHILSWFLDRRKKRAVAHIL